MIPHDAHVHPAVGFDAVVLAGGGGRRLGGADKGALVVGGEPLLDRVLRAVGSARRRVVVGEPRPTTATSAAPVTWTRERPAGGGPLAGLAAGLKALGDGEEGPSPSFIVVLATDLPWVAAPDVTRLLLALAEGHDAAVFADAGGRLQPLAAAYRAGPLRGAVGAAAPVHGRPVRLVLDPLDVVAVPDLGAAADCDTPDQLDAARAHFDRQR